VPATDIKYSRDVLLVLENSVASLRAKDINDALDPLQGHLRNGYEAAYSTIDPPALGVINVGTASGSFLMSVDDAIVVGFSEGVDQTTAILGTSFIVEDVTGLADPMNDTANGMIAGSISFNGTDAPDPVNLIGSDNVITFIPTVNFPYGTKIRVTIPGSADAVSGIMTSDRATVRAGHNTKDVVFLLEVYRLEELKVLMTVPAHDNRNVDHAENTIKVTFSAAPDCTTINNTNIVVKYDNGVFTVDPVDGALGTLISGTWECLADDPTITFTADSEFGYGRDFAVMLSSNVRDARAGTVSIYDPTQGYLVPAFSFGFGTEHLENVQIISNNAAGSISYPRELPIELIFDPEINCDTINENTVYVYRADETAADKLVATLTCSDPVHDTVTITPVDDTASSECDGTALCYDTAYILVVKGGYEGVCVSEKLFGDLSDDGCIESPEKVFTFRTSESPALSVKIDPPHNTVGVSPAVHPECIFSKPINTSTVENEPALNPEFPDPDGLVPNICLVKGFNKNSCDDPDVVALDPVTPYSYTDGNTTVVINPAATLDTEEWYTVVVSRDIEDTTGMRLTALNTASFKTSPGGLLNRVYVDGDTLETMKVVAEFNQDVDVTTVREGTFYLSFVNEFGGTTLVPGTVELGNWTGGGTCDPVAGNEYCDMATLTPDFLALFSCGETSADLQFELPMNTNFSAHLSTFIKNANYGIDPANVPVTGGDNEYIYTFVTPVPSAVHSVTYSNIVVGATSLNEGNEVPVNASFKINFYEPVDVATFTSDTIEIEDGRGDDGVTTSASATFTVTAPGTFKTSDAGK
ncbi:MAG TPA: Ig-like domain-containing protein, partial [bacterium]|nr:Ig-like domain-containing protein [bacterium]